MSKRSPVAWSRCLNLITALSLSPIRGNPIMSATHGLVNAWNRTSYPNPQLNPMACGRQEPSWVCDPDALMSSVGQLRLDAAIRHIANGSNPFARSPCSPGYRVSTAGQPVQNAAMRIAGAHACMSIRERETGDARFAYGPMPVPCMDLFLLVCMDRWQWRSCTPTRPPQ